MKPHGLVACVFQRRWLATSLSLQRPPLCWAGQSTKYCLELLGRDLLLVTGKLLGFSCLAFIWETPLKFCPLSDLPKIGPRSPKLHDEEGNQQMCWQHSHRKRFVSSAVRLGPMFALQQHPGNLGVKFA